MGQQAISALVTIACGIVGIAIVAVIVSKSADTGGVISAGGTALEGVIKAAVSPVAASAASTELGQLGYINPFQPTASTTGLGG